VAELAAAGRTNREIARAMFLSVHTVEDNLRRVYGKLGIRSRTELAAKSRTLLPTPRCRGPCLASAQVIPPPFQ
jgi:DNA-binding CsgD family transcriptional regulator